MTQVSTPSLTIEQTRALALDLLRELSKDIGDAERVNATLVRWADVLEHPAFSFVCMSAVQRVFLDCLTIVPPSQVTAGAVRYVDPEETP